MTAVFSRRLGEGLAAAAPLTAAALCLAAALLPTPQIPSPRASRWVRDVAGRRVGLSGPFARAAVIVPPSVSEYLVATGRPETLALTQAFNGPSLDSGLVGRMFPAARRGVTFFRGPTGQGPGLEQMLRLLPSAVFARRPAAPTLQRLGLPTIVLANANAVTDVERQASILAYAAETAGREAVLVRDAAAQMDRLRADLAALPPGPRPRVLVMYHQSSGRIWAFGPTTLQTRLVAAAGGVDPLPPRPVARMLDPERLLRFNPDVILIMNTTPPSTAPAAMMADPVFASLRAVATRRVYRVMPGVEFFPGDLVDYPLFVRWTAELLHPALPRHLRGDVRSAYARNLGYAMSEADLDAALALSANAGSANYARFGR